MPTHLADGARAVIAATSCYSMTQTGARAEIMFMPQQPRNSADVIAHADNWTSRRCACPSPEQGHTLTPFHTMFLMCPATTTADVDRHSGVFLLRGAAGGEQPAGGACWYFPAGGGAGHQWRPWHRSRDRHAPCWPEGLDRRYNRTTDVADALVADLSARGLKRATELPGLGPRRRSCCSAETTRPGQGRPRCRRLQRAGGCPWSSIEEMDELGLARKNRPGIVLSG